MKKYILLTLLFFSFQTIFSQDNFQKSYSEMLELSENYLNNEEYEAANDVLSKAINLNNLDPLAYYMRARAIFWGYIGDSPFSLAMSDCQKALSFLTKKDKEFKGEIYSLIANMRVVEDEGDWCKDFKKSCNYNNQDSCKAFNDLCQ